MTDQDPPAEPAPADRWTGRPRIELQAELASARRVSVRINWALWGIAGGVMVYGLGNVTALLLAHATPWPTAWLLSGMVDLGLCVALWGDRVLHTYGRSDSWLTALRWITAAMTWALNVAGNALPVRGHPDWVGVGIHSCGPALLVVVAEAAGAIQRHVTAIILEIESALTQATRITGGVRKAPTVPIRETAVACTPARNPESVPKVKRSRADSADSASRPGKEEVVAELAAQIAAEADGWTPDYPTLMQTTGFSRSWCEKRVAEARAAASTSGAHRLHTVTNSDQANSALSAISAESAAGAGT